MDLTKCAEILSKRQCSGSDVCCAAHGFNIPPRKAVIIGGESNPVNIKNDDEYILLKSFDEYALLEMFIALQRDRVLVSFNLLSILSIQLCMYNYYKFILYVFFRNMQTLRLPFNF